MPYTRTNPATGPHAARTARPVPLTPQRPLVAASVLRGIPDIRAQKGHGR